MPVTLAPRVSSHSFSVTETLEGLVILCHLPSPETLSSLALAPTTPSHCSCQGSQ